MFFKGGVGNARRADRHNRHFVGRGPLLASLLGARTLLGAPGIAARSKDAIREGLLASLLCY